MFIKIIIKAISLKMKIVYIDESNFHLENNHLKVWRNNKDIPFFNTYKRGRKNIILSIEETEVLHFEINNGINKSINFLIYMKKLIERIEIKDLPNYLLIIDNCCIHITKELKYFYNSNKMKVLTIVP